MATGRGIGCRVTIGELSDNLVKSRLCAAFDVADTNGASLKLFRCETIEPDVDAMLAEAAALASETEFPTNCCESKGTAAREDEATGL